ncbi:hypothetical protein OSG_eHP15_00025 [environmental Halophage eHP-15]|nr:hypothetical protein OSG_eHP15_00025 [environmental Halophage eHP-15]
MSNDNEIPNVDDISIPSSVQADQLEISGGAEQVTQGTINDYEFILRVDGDAPDELVAEIEGALADVKKERED